MEIPKPTEVPDLIAVQFNKARLFAGKVIMHIGETIDNAMDVFDQEQDM